uniref:CAZy families CBM9 protein n=1 Tax=uncultured Intrasporangium sp. TaxID=332040 RepID=A0A060BZI6_9MICO|nr:CAZy families CBM9 protein [uncultured Intrasporangium sp.]
MRYMCLTGPTFTGVGTEYAALLDVARNLVRRGVAAVVAPQLRVSQPAWLAFCQTLYTGLTKMQPIDGAIVDARQAMAQESDDLGWGAPVFFSRCVDGYLFDDGTLPDAPLPEDHQARVTSRLNSLRIRTASRETMSEWSQGLNPRRGDR